MERTMVRRAARAKDNVIAEPQETRRPVLIGVARPVVAEDIITAPSETDLLLHQSHEMVAQLREAVGRPRLDL